MGAEMSAISRSRLWLICVASVLGLGILALETPFVYAFMSHQVFANTMEQITRNIGSEDRLSWLLERQGFEIEPVDGTNWAQAALQDLYTDCDFPVSDLRSYLQCRDSQYSAFIEELGYDPEGHATVAHTDTITYLFGICGRDLLIIWFARKDGIEHARASSNWSCL